jgi:hypothetical protein
LPSCDGIKRIIGPFRASGGRFRAAKTGLRHFALARAARSGDNSMQISNQESR